MSAERTVVARGLTKRYREVLAVDSLDLEVRRGEVYGFLGRNGAGKTTTIRMLLGLISPTSGEVELLGRRIVPGETKALASVGYLVESASAYPNLTVRENLDIQRRLTRAPRRAVAEAIERLGLGEYAGRRAGRLSLGNKQRLSLARALLHAPEVLVLDEPANALDPAGIVEIRELIRSLADERGVTVFLSSHILAEIAQVVDRIGIVHRGRLLEESGIEELARRARSYLDVRVSEPDRAAVLLRERYGVIDAQRRDDDSLRLPAEGLDPAAVARLLIESGMELSALVPVAEDLESHFLRMTGDER